MKNLLGLTLLFFTTFAYGDFEHTEGIIGTLILPEVSGSYPCSEFRPKEIPIFKAADTTTPFGKIYIANPSEYSATDEGCLYGADVVEYSITESPKSHGELPKLDGAIVLNKKGSWYKIALQKDAAWVKVNNSENYWSVEKLLMNHSAFLRTGYPVPVISNPIASAGTTIRVANSYIPAKVLEFKSIGGKLWIKVQSHSKAQCDGEERPKKPFLGWLPFHDMQGQPTVWYFSKGC